MPADQFDRYEFSEAPLAMFGRNTLLDGGDSGHAISAAWTLCIGMAVDAREPSGVISVIWSRKMHTLSLLGWDAAAFSVHSSVLRGALS